MPVARDATGTGSGRVTPPPLQVIIAEVIVPALLERFLAEQAASAEPSNAHRQGPLG